MPLIFISTPVKACFLIGISERLQTACYVTQLNDRLLTEIDLQNLSALSQRLGLGYEDDSGYPKYWYQYGVSPYLAYDPNFNGGNPDKPLILNGLEFNGDQNFVAKPSSSLGIWADVRARLFWGPERYLSSSISVSKDFSLDHSLTKHQFNLSICSKNHALKGFYLDLCLEKNNEYKQLSSNKLVSKVPKIEYVTALNSGILSSTEFGKKVSNSDNVVFDTYFLKETILRSPRLGFWGATEWSNGSSENRLLPVKSFEFGISGIINSRKVSLSISSSKNEGLSLFGENIEQRQKSLEVRTEFIANSNIVLRYTETNSPTSFFEDSYVSLRLESGF